MLNLYRQSHFSVGELEAWDVVVKTIYVRSTVCSFYCYINLGRRLLCIIHLLCSQYRIAYSCLLISVPGLMGLKPSYQLSIVCAVSSQIGPHLAVFGGEDGFVFGS